MLKKQKALRVLLALDKEIAEKKKELEKLKKECDNLTTHCRNMYTHHFTTPLFSALQTRLIYDRRERDVSAVMTYRQIRKMTQHDGCLVELPDYQMGYQRTISRLEIERNYNAIKYLDDVFREVAKEVTTGLLDAVLTNEEGRGMWI